MTNFLFYLSIGDIKDRKMAVVELATTKSPNISLFEYVLVSKLVLTKSWSEVIKMLKMQKLACLEMRTVGFP